MKTLRLLAFISVGFAYGVIVIGFVVRITGSGMGCGPDWPLCNGQVIPRFTSSEVVIEWLHRIAVVGLSLLTIATVAVAYGARRRPGGSGPGGTLRPAGVALAILVVQSLAGRQAVKFELDPPTVVAHLGLALALLATLLVLGLRATDTAPRPAIQARAWPLPALAAAGVGAAVILLGGLTANLGAGWACEGFPLCSGRLWPATAEGGLAHIHWTHRLLAYALFFHLLGLAIGAGRRRAATRVRRAAWAAFALGATQIAVGAVMVLASLPPVWRGVHAAVGTAVWVALVYVVWASLDSAAGNAGYAQAPSAISPPL